MMQSVTDLYVTCLLRLAKHINAMKHSRIKNTSLEPWKFLPYPCPPTRAQHCSCLGQSKMVCLKPYNLSYLFFMVVSFKCLFPLSPLLLKFAPPHIPVHLFLPLPHFSAPLQSLSPTFRYPRKESLPPLPIHSYASVY